MSSNIKRLFHNMRPLFPYFKRYGGRYALTFLFLMFADILQLLIPRLLKITIDRFDSPDFTAAAMEKVLLRHALYILLMGLGIYVARVLWRLVLINTSISINVNLRNRFFAHLCRMDQHFYNQHRTGELMALATNDIQAVTNAFRGGAITLFDGTFMFIASLAFMLYTNATLTLYVFLPLPFITFITLRFGHLIHKRFEITQKVFADLTEKVREYLWGLRIIRGHDKDDLEKQRFDRLNQETIRKNMHLVKVQGLFFPAMFVFGQLSYLMLLYFGSRGVLSNRVTTGDFVAFISYIMLLTWPTMAFGWSVNLFERGSASMKRLERIFSQDTSVPDQGSRELPAEAADIQVRDLRFRYPGTHFLLNIPHLTIAPKSFVAFIGKTGSGKSTLIKLLTRTYPCRGITIGGIPLADITQASLRRFMAVVPQEPILFSATIRENIAFGNPTVPFSRIEEVARICAIDQDIRQFPAGYDTLVGERGVTLSGGQKQRLTLARAILLQRPLLLLDDCLSAVDAGTEKRILTGLKASLRQTTLFISNRIAAIMHADNIVVFRKGRVEHQGTHDDLLCHSPTYQQIFERQNLLSEISQEEMSCRESEEH